MIHNMQDSIISNPRSAVSRSLLGGATHWEKKRTAAIARRLTLTVRDTQLQRAKRGKKQDQTNKE